MRRLIPLLFLCLLNNNLHAQPKPVHNLVFDSLAKRWDDAIPLGNGWLGALIWQKNENLRLSLDRVDLWDDRPMPDIDKLKFDWITDQVRKGQYDTVQKLGDLPYEKNAAPTKIPGAAIEFDLSRIGRVVSNTLDIQNGLSTIKFDNGVVLNNYIHAINQVGYFGFENLSASDIIPELVIPNYNTGRAGDIGNSVVGVGLERLGYPKGNISRTPNSILFHQPTWNGNYYEVLVKWYRIKNNKLIGQWTITNNKPASLKDPDFNLAEPTNWPSHLNWWNNYWKKSSITLPDKQLEKQYYLEMYKFACVARNNTPPISLQAVWTADNGSLPPWKGDFHHDLNTQLSYWPGYTGNHLDLTESYTNWLWKVKGVNKKWTRNYFGVEGLNIPGVTTISGKEMGGWIQYSMSPTTAAWISQHFYWQWKYSMDDRFLKERCYPYLSEVKKYLSGLMNKEKSRSGKFKLPLSSSPEFHENSLNAWFKDFTNYDLALVKNFYGMESAVTRAVKNQSPVEEEINLLPSFSQDETGLLVAPGQRLDASHRHMSPYMAIYPLCLLDIDKEEEKSLIEQSLLQIEAKGTDYWCGYSFSWMACIYARAKQAEKAVRQLQIFSSNFCGPNSFHLNGDQKNGQYSKFTYRPFTLEGNFAFAQGVHELLIQTHNETIEVFPATPKDWKNVSFKTLRVEGAFLVSAYKEGGQISEIKVTAEKNSRLKLKIPFKTFYSTDTRLKYSVSNGILEADLEAGQSLVIKNGYE